MIVAEVRLRDGPWAGKAVFVKESVARKVVVPLPEPLANPQTRDEKVLAEISAAGRDAMKRTDKIKKARRVAAVKRLFEESLEKIRVKYGLSQAELDDIRDPDTTTRH